METFKVAVYGTLMAGEINERWGNGALERVSCVIRGKLYDTGYGYPAFIPDENGMETAAELLTVTAETLAKMDQLEGYPQYYRRESITAMAGGKPVQALVYVMNELPAQAKKITCGDWREYRKNI